MREKYPGNAFSSSEIPACLLPKLEIRNHMTLIRSKIDSLLIFNRKQHSHGVLVLHKTYSRLTYPITQEPLGLWRHLSDLLQGNHEELVFRWTQSRLAEKYSNRLPILVPMNAD